MIVAALAVLRQAELVRLVCALAGLTLSGAAVVHGQTNPVQVSRPPVRGFYGKSIDCGGIPVRAAQVVENRALVLACEKVTRMLGRAPQAKANMLQWEAELHIIGRDQQTSDLPELQAARGKEWDPTTHQDVDQRTRGVGGLYSSCGEENLLGLPSDRYRGGSDICVHEFAHAVMGFGLDDNLRKAIEGQLRRATAAGLWKGRYSATNPEEYWAELSMWYFGAHGERGDNGPAPGSAALATYDPGGYALLDRIFTGALRPAAIQIVPVRAADNPAHPRSVASATAAQLVLINNSARTYAVEWLDFKGAPQSYGTLGPMSDRTLATYVTHAWALKGSGRASQFVVEAPISRWRIDE